MKHFNFKHILVMMYNFRETLVFFQFFTLQVIITEKIIIFNFI